MQLNPVKLKAVYGFTLGLILCVQNPLFAAQKSSTAKQTCHSVLPIPKDLKSLSKSELQKIQAKLKSFDRLKLDFKQGIYSTLRDKLRFVNGEAYFAKPDKLRWNKVKPREEYTFNGKDLYVYNPTQKSAIKFSSQGSQAAEFRQLLSIVLSFDELIKKYGDAEMKIWEDVASKTIYLQASPKQSLQEFIVKGERDQQIVQSVCLQYADGKFNAYEFTRSVDQKFDDNVFNFVKPEGVKLEVYD